MKELPIPPQAAGSDKARELLRVWAADGKQHVSIAAGIWKDPESWGIMIVDLMKHLANAYEEAQGLPTSETLKRIRSGIDAESAFPTDSPTGGMLK